MNTQIVEDIQDERTRQDRQWGGSEHDDRHSTHDWISYIVKHLGKAVQWPTDWAHFRYQMVRVASLAVAAIEWIDRNWADARARGPVPRPDGTPYAAADPNDYDLLTDAMDNHLDPFLHDDDVAAVAIYVKGVEDVGKFASGVMTSFIVTAHSTGKCLFCKQDISGGEYSPYDNGKHSADCPALLIIGYLEDELERNRAEGEGDDSEEAEAVDAPHYDEGDEEAAYEAYDGPEF